MLSVVASVVVLGADEVVDPETTIKNPHPIDIAREKPPLASLTSLTQRGMRARSGRRGAMGRFQKRVRMKNKKVEWICEGKLRVQKNTNKAGKDMRVRWIGGVE